MTAEHESMKEDETLVAEATHHRYYYQRPPISSSQYFQPSYHHYPTFYYWPGRHSRLPDKTWTKNYNKGWTWCLGECDDD